MINKYFANLHKSKKMVFKTLFLQVLFYNKPSY